MYGIRHHHVTKTVKYDCFHILKLLNHIALKIYIPTFVLQGLAKYVEWSANMLDVEVKIKLKNAELQAKKDQLRIWTGFKPPVTNSKPIHDQKFTGKVCLTFSDDSVYSSCSHNCMIVTIFFPC
jgi:hypothetical protein